MTVDELRKLAEGCHNAAEFIGEKPGLQSASHVLDLYQTVADLALELAELKASAQRAQTSGGMFNG